MVAVIRECCADDNTNKSAEIKKFGVFAETHRPLYCRTGHEEIKSAFYEQSPAGDGDEQPNIPDPDVVHVDDDESENAVQYHRSEKSEMIFVPLGDEVVP